MSHAMVCRISSCGMRDERRQVGQTEQACERSRRVIGEVEPRSAALWGVEEKGPANVECPTAEG